MKLGESSSIPLGYTIFGWGNSKKIQIKALAHRLRSIKINSGMQVITGAGVGQVRNDLCRPILSLKISILFKINRFMYSTHT